MLLIDDFMKFTAVYFLKKKSDAAESFKAYKTHVERQHQGSGKDYVIKAVCTDAGGEYTGEAIIERAEEMRNRISVHGSLYATGGWRLREQQSSPCR